VPDLLALPLDAVTGQFRLLADAFIREALEVADLDLLQRLVIVNLISLKPSSARHA